MVYFVYVTFPNKSEAKKLAKALIKNKLAVCANIFPVESIYRWRSTLEDTNEVVANFKTIKKNLNKLQREIKKLHPYEVPCIASIEVSKINKEYLFWLNKELK